MCELRGDNFSVVNCWAGLSRVKINKLKIGGGAGSRVNKKGDVVQVTEIASEVA
jgi:hypothetical protein